MEKKIFQDGRSACLTAPLNGSNALALKLKTKAPSPKPNNEHKNISYDRSSRAAPYLRVYSTSSGASGPARATRSTSEHASG